MKRLAFLLIVLSFFLHASAQQLTKQDYARAVSFISTNLFNKKVFNINTQFSWFADSTGVSFVVYSKEGKVFTKMQWKKMQAEPMFDHSRLAKLLSDSLHKEIKPMDLPFYSPKYIDKSHLEFTIDGKDFSLDLNTYSLTAKKKVENNPLEEKSPNGKWIAYTKNYNLFIKSTLTGEEKQLSTAGVKNYEYATYYGWGEIMEGENGERPPHLAVGWSPDSKWIGCYITDFRKGQKMYLLDWSIDTLYKPKLLSYYRGSPGDTDMVYSTPVFFNTETGEEIHKDAFRNVNAANFEWAKEPGVIYIENRVRGYQKTDLYREDLSNKKTELLYSETSATNIDNYNSQVFGDSSKMIITSEKDGWKQLYLLTIKGQNVNSNYQWRLLCK